MTMEKIILNALIQQKKRFSTLTDISTMTEQLAEALDRSDEVSVQVLLSMRQEPLSHLEEIQNNLRRDLHALPEEEAIYLHTLLGGGPAKTPIEQQLADQVATNMRVLQRITALDQRISITMGGSESYYTKYR